jgi:hypothetical protein
MSNNLVKWGNLDVEIGTERRRCEETQGKDDPLLS